MIKKLLKFVFAKKLVATSIHKCAISRENKMCTNCTINYMLENPGRKIYVFLYGFGAFVVYFSDKDNCFYITHPGYESEKEERDLFIDNFYPFGGVICD